MQLLPEPVLSLLHVAAFGTLATHSRQLPDYPYATAASYALDAAHHPIQLNRPTHNPSCPQSYMWEHCAVLS